MNIIGKLYSPVEKWVRNKASFSLLFMMLLAIWTYCIAMMSMWRDDDLVYQFRFDDFGTMETWSDLIYSQYNHFFSWNGRVVAHTIVQIFSAFLGQRVFAVCAALTYVLYVGIIAKIADTSWRNTRATVTIILLAMFSFTEQIVPTVFVGYWMMYSLVLIWLYIFLKLRGEVSIWQVIALSFLSFIAGNAQESICYPIIMALFVHVWRNRTVITKQQIILLAFFCLGGLVVAMSPSSRARAIYDHSDIKITLFNEMIYLRAIYLLIIVVAYLKIVRRYSIMALYRSNSLFFDTIVFTILLTLFIPWCRARMVYCVDLMSIVILVRILPCRWFGATLSVLLLVFVMAVYAIHLDRLQYRRHCILNILNQYEHSQDGKVYYNLDSKCYYPLEGLSLPVTYDVSFEAMNKLIFRKKPGEKGYLRVLPTKLKDLDKMNPVTQVVSLGEFGPWLLIKSKSDSIRHFTLTSVTGFYSLHTTPRRTDFSVTWGYVVEDNDAYIASIVSNSEYPYLRYVDVEVEEQ